MIDYSPLWHTLLDRGMKKTDLIEKVPISSVTLAKLGSNKSVSLDIIERICNCLGCRIEDIVEIRTDKK